MIGQGYPAISGATKLHLQVSGEALPWAFSLGCRFFLDASDHRKSHSFHMVSRIFRTCLVYLFKIEIQAGCAHAVGKVEKRAGCRGRLGSFSAQCLWRQGCAQPTWVRTSSIMIILENPAYLIKPRENWTISLHLNPH